MRFSKLFVPFLCFILLPLVSFGWNYQGHVVIAQLAYDNLGKSQQKKVNVLATRIFSQLPQKEQDKLNRCYPTASTFAKIAMLPDEIRSWHLNTVFKKFHGMIPADLKVYANQNTRRWHYINLPYPDTLQCHTVKPQNVVWAINIIEKDFKTTHNLNTKAILMMYLEHLVGDANQPMHAISHINQNCQGDKGGNGYCLRWGKSGRCTKNLHALWDDAVGYLKPKQNVQRTVFRLEQAYPKAEMRSKIEDMKPRDWADEAYQVAVFAYGTPVGEKPNAVYYRRGQQLAKEQLALGGYRLARLINLLAK